MLPKVVRCILIIYHTLDNTFSAETFLSLIRDMLSRVEALHTQRDINTINTQCTREREWTRFYTHA